MHRSQQSRQKKPAQSALRGLFFTNSEKPNPFSFS